MMDVYCIRQTWIWMFIGKCLVKMLININHSDCYKNIVQTHLKYIIATVWIINDSYAAKIAQYSYHGC